MNLIKLGQTATLLLVSWLINPTISLAVNIIPNPNQSTPTQIKTGVNFTMSKLVDDVLNHTWLKVTATIYLILGGLAVFFLIWSGIQYMTSGDAKVVETAKRRIIQIMLGIAILTATAFIIGLMVGISKSVINGSGLT